MAGGENLWPNLKIDGKLFIMSSNKVLFCPTICTNPIWKISKKSFPYFFSFHTT